LSKQKPPFPIEENGDFDEFIYEKTARFVSLIPFKTDTETFNDLPDVLCNSQQFLDLKAGGKKKKTF
jgi:hypothetical protein